MSAEAKNQKLKELEARYSEAQQLADELNEQVCRLRDEIANEKAKFPVGAVIAIDGKRFKTTGYGYHAKTVSIPHQEKYKITRITDYATFANRIKKDGSEGAQKKLYSWDLGRAKLLEPPK